MDCSKFGTEEFPIHASQIQAIVQCELRTLLIFLNEQDEAGQAADTGSAVHKAIDTWHKDQDLAGSLDAMHAALSKYPKADLSEASSLFFRYTQDPKNTEAEIVACEQKIKITVAAAPEDQTQTPITIVGTFDQIRRESGVLKLWDLKTTKKTGMWALNNYLYQILTYCVGATDLFKEPVQPGGIIRVRSYEKTTDPSPPGVFWHYTNTLEQGHRLLDHIRHKVAVIRAGRPLPSPGDHCFWCPARSIDECLPKLMRIENVKDKE